MLNALFYHPDPQKEWVNLMQQACWRRSPLEPDDENDNDDLDDDDSEFGDARPMMYNSGVYFLCDVWAVSLYRLGGGVAEDRQALAVLMSCSSWQTVCSAFGLSGTRVPRGTYSRNRVPNRGTMTVAIASYAPLNERGQPDIPVIDFQVPRGIRTRARQITEDEGPDIIRDAGEEPFWDSSFDIQADDHGLSTLWGQFMKDTWAKSPNPKQGNRPSYTRLNAEQRAEAKPEWMRDRELSKFSTLR